MEGYGLNEEIERLLDKGRKDPGNWTRDISKLAKRIVKKRGDNKSNVMFKKIIEYTSTIDRKLVWGVILGIHSELSKRKKLNDLMKFKSYMKFILDKIVGREKDKYAIFEEVREVFVIAFLVCYKKNTSQLTRNVTRFIEGEGIEFLRNRVCLDNLFASDSVSKVRGFLHDLRDIDKNIQEYISLFLKSVKEERNLLPKRRNNIRHNRMYVLKKFNSIYPAILSEESWGGGFFIRWLGKGIAVDPGYSFFRQLQHKGFNIYDIDCIFVTHAHDDHSSDIDTIFSILYKVNKLNLTRKKILLFGSDNVIKKYSYLSDYYKQHIFPLKGNSDAKKANNILKIMGILVRIRTFDAFHNETPFYTNSCIGIFLELYSEHSSKRRCISFSGDTGFRKELVDQYSRRESDIFVLNVGKIEENLRNYDENHLGIFGCRKIVLGLQKKGNIPKIIILSEFGVEMKGRRIEISELIKRWIPLHNHKTKGGNLSIIPGDNSLMIDLNDLKIIKEDGSGKIKFNKVNCIYTDHSRVHLKYV
jgi:hypothetical protein